MTSTGLSAAYWLAGRGRWARGAIAFVTGALMAVGHAPFDFPWIWFLAMPVLVWLLDGASHWRAGFWTGWMAGFGYFIVGLHWIGHAFLVDADQFAWLMPFAVTLLPLGLGLFWGLAASLARSLIWPEGIGRVISLALLVGLAEFARGHILTGLPWALPAYIWVETPVMQMASLGGSYFLSLLTLGLTALPAVALVEGRRRIAWAAVALLFWAGAWGYGVLRVPAETAYAEDAPLIRVVQPNATQELKWIEPHHTEFYKRLLDLSADPQGASPDIIIWPEMAIRFPPAEFPEERLRIAASGRGAVVILGALYRTEPTRDGDGPDLPHPEFRNAMVHRDAIAHDRAVRTRRRIQWPVAPQNCGCPVEATRQERRPAGKN